MTPDLSTLLGAAIAAGVVWLYEHPMPTYRLRTATDAQPGLPTEPPAAIVELRDAIAAHHNYTDVGQPYPVTTSKGIRWVVKARIAGHKGVQSIGLEVRT